MTLALPTYPAAHRTATRGRLARAVRWIADRLGAAEKIDHEGVTELTPIIVEPEPTDALDPTWQPFAPDLLSAALYE